MHKGIALGFAAFAVFSFGDASIKALGSALPVFEIGFFVTLFALFAIPFARPAGERWRDVFRLRRPALVFLRAATGTTAGILGIVAFTTLPFAEAYALIFLAPLVATLLSFLFLGESIGWRRLSAVFVGLAGVLLVIRPGFRELLPGHFAALGVAACAGTTVIVLRVLGPTERRISLITIAMLVPLAVNGALMLPEFRAPAPPDFIWLVTTGLLAGLGHILLMAATRAAPANRIAPGQYTQIVWAVVLGAVFFGEYPDALALAGMALVALSGLFTFLREEKRGVGPTELTVVAGRTPRSGGRD